jgi:nitrogenase molybdenum-iron protein beta chain
MNQAITVEDQGLNHGLPCSLGGALSALSGIDGVDILVNGPSSCTGFAAGMVESCHPLCERNANRFNRLAVDGHPRIPCTEITDTDVILGISDKLVQAVELLVQKGRGRCIAVVNSCSLSLIGEDADNILMDHDLSSRILYLESTGCARSISKGYSEAIIKLIEKETDPKAAPARNTVNILGLPITQYSWKHDAREIRRLMGMAGLKVNTVLAAGTNREEIRNLVSAGLNVVINPEYGIEIAEFLRERFGQPYVAAKRMPIGFDATRGLMDDVCGFMGIPRSDALKREEEHCRREGFLALTHSSRTEKIRGLPVAIFGEWAFVAGLGSFLHDYLGCRPVILGISGRETLTPGETGLLPCRDEGVEILLNPGMDQTLSALHKQRPVITFGSAFEEYLLNQVNLSPGFFIQTSMPEFNRTNLVHRPYLGFAGGLTFIEAILNCRLTSQYPYSFGEGESGVFQS